MLPKKGRVLPKKEKHGPYRRAVAQTLRSELGATHRAVKTVMGWTGASERTVKNWLAEVGGPSGEHLVDLIRHSDGVLETVLAMAGRRHVARAQRLLEVRKALLETVDQIDRSLGNAQG
jgi:hypothetical protein